MQRLLVSRAGANWLYWQGAIIVVILYLACKVLARILEVRIWHWFGWSDVVVLAVLALGVGAFTRYLRERVQRELDEAERRRREAEALAAENEAVVRVAQAVAREFAQPLSGALAYSELLMMRADDLSAFERQELEGLREGVLQLERMLLTLRHTVEHAPECAGRHIADDVERDIAAPRPRLNVRSGAARTSGDTSAAP